MEKSRQHKSTHHEVTERDLRILKSLWKWKVISTKALAVKYFPEAKLKTAYRRLLRLAKSGYIKLVQVDGRFREGWSLDQKGYKHIRYLLGELAGEGFKSENYHHDYLATAFHWGEWLINQPEYTQTFSEQQLRQIPLDLWDEWVPHSDTHRADGYSLYFQGEEKIVVAFETELNPKSKKRYESVVAFYDTQTHIRLVFWLIASRGILNAIKRSFEIFHVRDWSKHHFLLLSDFSEKGWSAPFIEGCFKGKTPADFLLPQTPVLLPLSSRNCVTQAFLDLSKNSIISKTS